MSLHCNITVRGVLQSSKKKCDTYVSGQTVIEVCSSLEVIPKIKFCQSYTEVILPCYYLISSQELDPSLVSQSSNICHFLVPQKI